MKIALIGYGKMGKAIEPIAKERGHEIVLRATCVEELDTKSVSNADVALNSNLGVIRRERFVEIS